MRYSLLALLTLGVISGCASKVPHDPHKYQFVGVHADGSCFVDDSKTHWDAKTGALVLTCKQEVKR